MKSNGCRDIQHTAVLFLNHSPPRDAMTTDDVMEAVHNESSLAYFEQIVNRFNLPMKDKI